METVINKNGNETGIYNGHVYYKNRVLPNGRIYWKCQYKKVPCRANVVTDNGSIVRCRNEHSHDPDYPQIEALRVLSKMRQLAETTDESPDLIVSQLVAPLHCSITEKLPNVLYLKRTIKRLRNLQKCSVKGEEAVLNEAARRSRTRSSPTVGKLQFVKNSKGNTMALYNDHIFYRNKRSKSFVYWICQGRAKNCRARLVSMGDQILRCYNVHNHEADASDIQARLIMSEISACAATSDATAEDIVASLAGCADESVAARLPSIDNIKRKIKQIRSAPRALPAEIDFTKINSSSVEEPDDCRDDAGYGLDVFRNVPNSNGCRTISIVYTFKVDEDDSALFDQSQITESPLPRLKTSHGDILHAAQLTKQGFNHSIVHKCEWADCDYVTEEYPKFQKHVTEHCIIVLFTASRSKYYACLWNACGFKTEDSGEFKRHVNFHAYHSRLKAIGTHINDRYGLEKCSQASDEINRVPEIPSDYVCLWVDCGYTFDSMQCYVDHVWSHVLGVEDTSGKIKCTWLGCKQKSASINTLKIHMRKHTNENVTACPTCGLIFATNAAYEDHCRQQVGVRPIHKCESCERAFMTEELLQNHSRCHLSVHKCKFCGTTFSAAAGLVRHIKYAHVVDKSFNCQFCCHTASSQSDLQAHVLRHKVIAEPNIENKYVCPHCNDLFAAGHQLTKHIMRVHRLINGPGLSRFKYIKSNDGLHRLVDYKYENEDAYEQHNYKYRHKKIDTVYMEHSYTRKPRDGPRDDSDDKIELVEFPTDPTPNVDRENCRKTVKVPFVLPKKRDSETPIATEFVQVDMLNKLEEYSPNKLLDMETIELIITDIDDNGVILKSEMATSDDNIFGELIV